MQINHNNHLHSINKPPFYGSKVFDFNKETEKVLGKNSGKQLYVVPKMGQSVGVRHAKSGICLVQKCQIKYHKKLYRPSFSE